jgi:predicted dehydrogenase
MTDRLTRRDVLKTSAILAGGTLVPSVWIVPEACGQEAKQPSERPNIGCIGTGSRGTGISAQAANYGPVLAIADVDMNHANEGNQRIAKGKAEVFQDYRKVLDRKDIDVVIIGTPDHWHTKICIEAMQAGKDVYCEKPLTLTIDEGKMLCKVTRDTGKVLQVGTQQRSEFGNMFVKAVAMAREGRLGKIKRVLCSIGGAPTGGPFKPETPPAHLNWDMWLGQCPKVEYMNKRCHYEFRWWYEYSGGKLTDWGAHHVDIAQWAIGMEESGPQSVEVLSAEHPVPFKDGYPTVDNKYNTATKFQVKCMFNGGIEMIIRDEPGNGIWLEGEKGTIFVSRGELKGELVDELKTNPIPEKTFVDLRKGKKLSNHMENFFLCVKDRGLPASDVFTHHRALTTCHLTGIAMRLGRTLKWDPKSEQIVGDSEANSWLGREQRKGYEIKV